MRSLVGCEAAAVAVHLNLRSCHSSLLPSPFCVHSNPRGLSASFETLGLSRRLAPRSSRRVRFSASSSTSPPAPMAASSAQAAEDKKPFAVLFVCLGNICRSPAAEAVFTDLVKKRGLESHFKIDSCGTIGYHEGNPADSRMRAASKRRGIEVTSISRPLRPSDFMAFDLILAMDKQNRDDILNAYERWSFKEVLPADAQKKVKLMCSYCRKHKETEVPDPYYGGPQGFEKMIYLRLVRDGALKSQHMPRKRLLLWTRSLDVSADERFTVVGVLFSSARNRVYHPTASLVICYNTVLNT